MRSDRWRFVFCLLFVLLAPLLSPAKVAAADGVVWLTAHSEGPNDEAWIRIPLEWLANVDREEDHSDITFDGEKIDCTELWLAHKDLPVGESREVRRGVTKDGDKYVARVVSENPVTEQTLGKVHILVRDEEGKETDVRFPLDMATVLENLGGFIKSFFGIETDKRIEAHDQNIEFGDLGDLKKLGDYGPFDIIRVRETDGSRVRVSIE